MLRSSGDTPAPRAPKAEAAASCAMPCLADIDDARRSPNQVRDSTSPVGGVRGTAAAATGAAAAASEVVGADKMNVATDAVATAATAAQLQPLSSSGSHSGTGAGTARDGRVCSICGDCAVGCNFNAITCGSCKAFFRRNATKSKGLKCMFTGNCVMNTNTRRFCTACRLRKCFSVGMKPDLILDEEEKRRRKAKVLMNRKKKLQTLHCLQQASASSRRADGGMAQAAGCCPPPAPSSCMLSWQPPLPPAAGGEPAADDSQQTNSRSSDTNGSGSSSSSPLVRVAAEVPPDAAVVPTKPTGCGGSLATAPATPAVFLAATATTASAARADGYFVDSAAARRSANGVGQQSGQHRCACPLGTAPGSDDLPVFDCRRCTNHLAAAADAASVAAAGAASSALVMSVSSAPVVAANSISDTDMQLLYVECFRPQPVRLPSAQRRLMLHEREEVVALERCYSSTIGEIVSNEWDEIKPTCSIEYIINLSSVVLRRLISFAKSLRGFASASQDIQVTLLKAGAVACLAIRSAQVYDPDRRCWDDGRGKTVSIDVIDQVFSGVDPVAGRRHGALMGAIKRLVPTGADGGCDLAVFALLQAIAMLSPEHALAACNDGDTLAILSDAQQRYMLLLRHHLEATYSYALAADVLPSLLQHLAMCKRYGVHVRRWLTVCNVSRIDPLLKELYNLESPRSAIQFAATAADP